MVAKPKGLVATALSGFWKLAVIFAITSTAIGFGLGIMSLPWFPHSLLWAQLLFVFATLLVVIAAAHSAIGAETGTLKERLLFALVPSTIAVALCVFVVTVIQIHKHDPVSPSGWSIQTGFLNLNGSSIGTLNGSNNSLVDGGSGSGKIVDIEHSNLIELGVNGMDSCAGGIEDWPCFVILEESRIQKRDRDGFERTASNFQGIVRLRLHLPGNQGLAIQCFTEFSAEVSSLRQQFDKPSDRNFYNALSHRPVCLGESPMGAHK